MKISLKAARTNAGFTQKEVAEQLDVTVETVRNWERGRSYPNAIRIQALEKLYGVPYDNLIFLHSNTL